MTSEFSKDEATKQVINIMLGSNPKPKHDGDKFDVHVTEQIEERDESYTNLLKHFVFVTRIRNYLKEGFKWIFFLILIGSIIALTWVCVVLFNKFIDKATIQQMIQAIPLFSTAVISFVSVIIAIPLTITKYLFSTKEDENITNIILHTQEHDTSGRQWMLDFKKIPDQIKKQNEDNVDDVKSVAS